MIRPRTRLVAAILAPVLMATSIRADDPPALSIADLAAYRAALEARPEPGSVRVATFADLWGHPEEFRGRPVAVVGRLARVFRQPSVGRFPALTEGWITSPRGEPVCVVFPTGGPGSAAPMTGGEVRFVGTFLRRITYRGADADRVAPLVVGPEPPVPDGSAGVGDGFGPLSGGDHAGDWVIGLVVAGGVGMMLIRRHLARPVVAPAPIGPAPAFRDGDDHADGTPEEVADHDDA